MFEKIFGVDQKKKAKMLGALDCGSIQYIGGHKAFPKPTYSEIYFYEDRLELAAYNLKIPYNKIKDIGNSNEMKRQEDWIALGIIGLFWKTNHIYTVIEYDDGIDTQTIVLDFQKGINYAQGIIYKKMLDCRKTPEQYHNTTEPQKFKRSPL